MNPKYKIMKDKIREWWMLSFCGGMADPINFNMFWACIIGAVIGTFTAVVLHYTIFVR